MESNELGAWETLLKDCLESPDWDKLCGRVERAYAETEVYPPREELFAALRLTPPERVRAVILGQDPYHEPGQAHGLAFSVRKGVKLPPSLRNIYKELESDLRIPPAADGDLTAWAEQGVLLLNTVLTVRAHQAFSHKGVGWETFTDAVIEAVNRENRPIVFLLWGAPAQKKAAMLNNPNHLILTAPHPSPLSVYRGFWGCGHFAKCNEFLKEQGQSPIDWQIENI